jgi:NAD/NADP transhydrogenase alpha subunit
VSTVLGTIAVTTATINVVGGFIITQAHAGHVQAKRSPPQRRSEG